MRSPTIDIGEKFGYWQVIENQGKEILCQCTACGTRREVFKFNLLNGKTKSCGCIKKGNLLEIGQAFGKLTVIDNQEIQQAGRFVKVLVLCSCGTEKYVYKHSLIAGNTLSCGCARKKPIKITSENPREYHSWNYIKQVCYNKQHPFYKKHGGCGIEVHPNWKDNFNQFFLDMGTAPNNTIIARIDTTGNYAPGNCFWSNRKKFWQELERAEINEFIRSYYTSIGQGKKAKISESKIQLILQEHMNGEANINNIARKFQISPNDVINIIFGFGM